MMLLPVETTIRPVALYSVLDGDNDHIVDSIKSVLPYVMRVYVIVNQVTQLGKPIEKMYQGTTRKLLEKEFKKEMERFYIIDCNEKNEKLQRDFGLDFIRGTFFATHVILIDADEVYTPVNIKKLMNYMSSPSITSFYAGCNTYWKDKEHVISPREEYKTLIAFRLFGDTKFVDSQQFTRAITTAGVSVTLPDVVFEHYSYARNSEESIKRKIDGFTHRVDMVPNWYEDVWKKWTPKMENLHPVYPPQYKKAVHISEVNLNAK